MEYTVYLVFNPHGDWHEGHVVHIKIENGSENSILEVACDKLSETKPDLDEWAVQAYLILEGNITPKKFFKR